MVTRSNHFPLHNLHAHNVYQDVFYSYWSKTPTLEGRMKERKDRGRIKSSALPHFNLIKPHSFSSFTPHAFPRSTYAPSSWLFYNPTFPRHPSPVTTSRLCVCNSFQLEHFPPPLSTCQTLTHLPRTNPDAPCSWKPSLISLWENQLFSLLCLHNTQHRTIIYGSVTASPNAQGISPKDGGDAKVGSTL